MPADTLVGMSITDGLTALSDAPLVLILLVAGAFAFAESGLGVGMVLPGETAILVLATTVTGPLRFVLMLVVVAVGVCAGDHVGYRLGRRHGAKLADSRIVHKLGRRHWDMATLALHRYGAWAVFFTRLLPVVRTLTPAVAGTSGVGYARFLPASLCGAFTWSALYVTLGAFAGASVKYVERVLGVAGWVGLGLLVCVVVVAVVRIRRRRDRRTRATSNSVAR